MSAVIQKSRENHRIGFYVICTKLNTNVFFSSYQKAKDFCEMKGWGVIRV